VYLTTLWLLLVLIICCTSAHYKFPGDDDDDDDDDGTGIRVLCVIRLLSAAQWQQDKRMAALDVRRRQLEQTRQFEDVVDLLDRLDNEARVYGRQAFNAWLRQRGLTGVTAADPVVDRLVSFTVQCSRNHGVTSPPVMTSSSFSVIFTTTSGTIAG